MSAVLHTQTAQCRLFCFASYALLADVALRLAMTMEKVQVKAQNASCVCKHS